MKFGAWFQPTGRSTAIMGSSSCEMFSTIIHIICSIIQFMADVWPGLLLLLRSVRTADMQVAIQGVTSSWGSTKQAVVDAWKVETEQCCDYCLSSWHYYFTYYIHYRHYYKIRIRDSAWHSLKKRGQRHSPSHGISVSSKQKHNRLSLGAPRCPASLAGQQQGWHCQWRM